MVQDKGDFCRYCGGQKKVRWSLVDWRQDPWIEWHSPQFIPANNELQQAAPVSVACSVCGLMYDFDSLATAVGG